MLGQVPLVLNKQDDKEDDDDDLDIVGEFISQTKSLSKDLQKQNLAVVSDKPLPYYRLKPSQFGRIVMRKTKRNEDSGSYIEIKHEKNDLQEIFKAFIDNHGKVILTHPKYSNHDVICPNVSSAKLWLDEYFDESIEDEVIFEDPKHLHSEPLRMKTPPPVLKRIKTPSLPSGKSTSNIALYLQTKQQKDEAELFYELGHTAFNNFFQRNVSRAQILVKAKEEIKTLEEEGKSLERDKQTLLKRRSKLFEDFTKTLNGLPVARKKAAVIELKELLKRDKEVVKAVKVEPVKKEPTGGCDQQPQLNMYPGQTPYTDITGIKTVRADGSILRPMNAFMLWAKERRAEMIAQGLSVSQVSQALSDQWRSLSEVDRSQFYKEAEYLKNLHKLQHPDYKFSPKNVRNTTTSHSPPRTYIRTKSGSPPPVSPNQPGDQSTYAQQSEPNQPPASAHHQLGINHTSANHKSGITCSTAPQQPETITHPAHIQVPRPLSQLRSQSLLLPRNKPHPRPTPSLIPAHQASQAVHAQANTKSTHFEVLNIPTLPSRSNIKISSTFTPRLPNLSMPMVRRESVEEVRFVNHDRIDSVEQLEDPNGTLNMRDIPADAADVLGLALQSSGVETEQGGQWQEEQMDRETSQVEVQEGAEQFVIQEDNIKHRGDSDEQQFIQIGGDNYQLLKQGGQQHPVEGQQLVLNQEQAQQLMLAQQQGQQLLLEQEQLMLEQEEGQQLLIDPSQHVFVDEQGRQVILRQDQQMMLQNQQMVALEDGQSLMQIGGQQLVQLENGQQLVQLDSGQQLVQLPEGQQMVQLEGQDGQRVMVAYQEHGDLLFQTQGEDLE